MRVFVTGTRGIPDIPGGVEKHCQELFPRIASKGHDVIVATRSSYVTKKISEWKGVKVTKCFAPSNKSLEAIVHTFLALLKAHSFNPDVVHIHAVGPSLLTPIARLMGFRVVFTNHGPDYDRKKWGKVAKTVLRMGEKLGGKFANEVIVISSLISDIVWKKCNRLSHVIYNGVTPLEPSDTRDFLRRINVESRKYILAVARFVPEKGLHDLINAFKKIQGSWKLVIAGEADHETEYSKKLRQMATEDERVVLTGYITGEPLNQVYSHAGLFVLPSYHEGLPIALLEAMSYGIPVVVSDIPANKEVNLPPERYFRCGDVADLKNRIEILIKKGLSKKERDDMQNEIAGKYDWEKIADQTIGVYRKALSQH